MIQSLLSAVKVGIIGGTGWMGKAMADVFLRTGTLAPQQLWIANRTGHNPYELTHPELNLTTNAQQLVDACDVVFLAVLPQQFDRLMLQFDQQLVVSIMAMVSMEAIAQQLQTECIVRSMPNAAIPELAAYTPWCAHNSVSEHHKAVLHALLSSFGCDAEVQQEDHLNFLTALTGSSHGWLAYVAQALIQLGVEHGIGEDLVEHAVRTVMGGVGALVAHESHSPSATVKILTDYAGSTAAGLLAFDRAQVAEGLRQGILASYERAKRPYLCTGQKIKK